MPLPLELIPGTGRGGNVSHNLLEPGCNFYCWAPRLRMLTAIGVRQIPRDMMGQQGSLEMRKGCHNTRQSYCRFRLVTCHTASLTHNAVSVAIGSHRLAALSDCVTLPRKERLSSGRRSLMVCYLISLSLVLGNLQTSQD